MPNRIRVLAAAVPLVAILGGCQFDGTIDAKGGAEVKLHYRVDPNAKLDKVSSDLESKDVKLISKSMDKDHYVDATIQTANVTKLPTTAFFKAAAITLVDGPDKGTKTLTVRYLNKTPTGKIPPNALEYYGEQIKVGLKLPGDVVKTNATESKGSSATWTIETTKFFAAKENIFEVTYKVGK